MPKIELMIAGAHTIIYAEDAAKARAFLRDVIGFPHVDAGDGWLIFELPPGEIAFHPAWDARPAGQHELYFMCADVEQTRRELEEKGVEFVSPVSDEGWGLLTRFNLPGAGEVFLYEPKHPSPLAQFSA